MSTFLYWSEQTRLREDWRDCYVDTKENLLETIKVDGKPDRLVNQYEPFVHIGNDPLSVYTRGNRVRGTNSVDRWGTEILFPRTHPARCLM